LTIRDRATAAYICPPADARNTRAIVMNVIWLNALSQRELAMSADLDATLAILTKEMPRLGPEQRRVVRRTIREIKRARWRLRIMGLKLWLFDRR